MKKKTDNERACGCASNDSDNCADSKWHDYTYAEKWSRTKPQHTPTPWQVQRDDNPRDPVFMIMDAKFNLVHAFKDVALAKKIVRAVNSFEENEEKIDRLLVANAMLLEAATTQTEAEKRYTSQEVLEVWKAKTPHFGGSGPHRYNVGSEYCSYCLRPQNFDEGKIK